MTARVPPKVSTWLLQHFGCSASNDAILGDLAEQFQQGRTRFWYWRQVLRAIPAGILEEVSGNKLLALRALVLGWTLVIAGAEVFRRLTLYLLFRQTGASPWVSLFLLIGLASLASAGIGWVVGVTHRPHQKAFVALYVASVYLVLLIWFCILGPQAPNGRGLALLLIGFAGNIISATSALIGAELASRPSEQDQIHRRI
jgi:hypothetical protein